MTTVDITPSWPAVLEIMLRVLANKKASREGRQAALDTLKQMSQVAQKHLDLHMRLKKAGITVEQFEAEVVRKLSTADRV